MTNTSLGNKIPFDYGGTEYYFTSVTFSRAVKVHDTPLLGGGSYRTYTQNGCEELTLKAAVSPSELTAYRTLLRTLSQGTVNFTLDGTAYTSMLLQKGEITLPAVGAAEFTLVFTNA